MKIKLSFIAVFLFPFLAIAQDTHYWTNQFGPKSTLLGGSNAAVSTDNSSVINNPGGLALDDISTLSLTTNAYSLNVTKYIDGAGKNLDMQSIKVYNVPLILSGMYKHKNFPRWTIGYAMLDKVRYKFNATQRYDGMVDVLKNDYSPGVEEFVSQLDMNSSLIEVWAGFTIAYKVNDHIGIGLSNFGAYRDNRFSYKYIARAVVNGPTAFETAASNFLYNMSYINVRNIFKLGVSTKFKNFDAGLTVTMPSFTMYSQAKVSTDLTGNNVLLDEASNFRGGLVANDRQTQLKANYKSPWSVSIGLSKRFKKTRIYITSEYFAAQKPYIYVRPENQSFIRPAGLFPSNSGDALQVKDGNVPVINFAIGVEHQLFNKVALLAGVRTDNSYFDEDAAEESNTLSFSNANLYHASFGVLIDRKNGKICLGFKGAYGSNTKEQIVNLANPDDNFTMEGEKGRTQFLFYNASFILGYIHYL